MEIKFHDMSENNLKYVVIGAYYKGEWLMVQHHKRSTWEMPGGHIEIGELPDYAAKRELYEETGAVEFTLNAICDYSVTRDGVSSLGRLYTAHIETLGDLPDSEIHAVMSLKDEMIWTYDAIQPLLFEKLKTHI